MNVAVEDRENDLHSRMKSGSVAVHREAETSNFVKHFISCKITEDIYKVFVAQLYYVYQSLEIEADKNCEHDCFSAVYFPTELNRVPALEEDLEYFYGPDWRIKIWMLDVTKRYTHRIHYVGHCDPSLLIAHAYTRYLGDISGGQILKYKLQKTFSFGSDGRGLQFYQFPEISDIKKFKVMYRNRLNSLDADEDLCARMEREVVMAFRFNIDLFQELDHLALSTNGYKDIF